MLKTLKRELYVALHAQTTRFRLVKYVVIFVIGIFIYRGFGWNGVINSLIAATILALIIHFLFRWKTNAWRNSWGPYKKMDIPG